MKKMFLFAAMASVAFASCTTDESVFDAAKEQGKIEFVAANYVAQTRGGHDTNGYATFSNADFSVYSWEDGTNYDLMYNVGVTYADDACTVSGTYYWPNKKAMDFTAVSPAAATGDDGVATVDRTSAGVSTITFEFANANDNTNETNLMYADEVTQTYDYDATSAPNNDPKVALLFRHVLAKLKVVLTQKDPSTFEAGVKSYEVKVKSLKMSNIQECGKLVVDETYMNAAKTDNANTVWTLADNPVTTEWTIHTNNEGTSLQKNEFDAEGKLTKTAKNYESTAEDFVNYYVMPQTITEDDATTGDVEGQYITIEYDVVTTFTSGTVATRPYTRTIPLSKMKSDVANWYTNKYITYTINISPADLVPITFSVQEEHWCEEVKGSDNVE